MNGYKQTLESWKKMMTRCYNSNSKDFKNYGARGIIVAPEWHNSTNFLNDMKSSWKLGLTLDRIDNNGNYSKDNCRWATRKEQNNNSRKVFNALHYTYQGLTLTIHQWADRLGIKRTTLDMRLRQYGWSVDKAFEGRLI